MSLNVPILSVPTGVSSTDGFNYVWSDDPIPEWSGAGVRVGDWSSFNGGLDLQISQLQDQILTVSHQGPIGNVAVVISRTDPYTILLQKIWAMLEANYSFTAMVPPGNRIKFLGASRDPLKETLSSGDVPEVRIILAGSTPNSHLASNQAGDTVRIQVQCASGDQRFDAMHNPLRWVIYSALANLHAVINQNGTSPAIWAGQNFVVSVVAKDIQDGVNKADMNRGIHGWSALWTAEILLCFKRDSL